MIVEYIRYSLAAERQSAFEAAYMQAQEFLATSQHCLSWELAQCVEESASYILRIEWDSQEGHMQGFRQSPEFRTFFAAIRPFLGDIKEMRHYEATAVVSRS